MAMTSPQEFREVVLELLPPQGNWSEEDYLWLTDHSPRLIEFTDGYIEVLPMPTDRHQGILLFFVQLFSPYLERRDGLLRFAPLRLRLRSGRFREPDLLLLRDRRDPRRADRYWQGADLVLEIVSPNNPDRDLVEKRREYAQTGIPEYWIVNPLDETITVLVLQNDQYAEHGVFARDQRASSALLAGFAVAVNDVFAVA
jgi:Uma2 family endonuclease